VESLLQASGYFVEANAAYPDANTGKSRELDIRAMTAQEVGKGGADFLFAVLLAECINNEQPMAFITKEPFTPFLHHFDIKLTGIPLRVRDGQDPDDWVSLPELLNMDRYHHYCKGRIATQYCSFRRKKGESGNWMATHEEEHFDAFRKLCDAIEQYQDAFYRNWDTTRSANIHIELYYPVVVLQGELLDIRQSGRRVSIRRTDHIQFRRAVAKHGEELDFQVDVVTERFMSRYVEIIKEEIEKAARRLRRRHGALRQAVEELISLAASKGSPAEVREVLEG